MARFGSVRFQFVHETVQAVPIFGSDSSSLERGFSVSTLLFYQKGMDNESDGSGSSFVSGKTVPTVPVSGSGSVPGPS